MLCIDINIGVVKRVFNDSNDISIRQSISLREQKMKKHPLANCNFIGALFSHSSGQLLHNDVRSKACKHFGIGIYAYN